jgi:hypothetical protein
MGEARAMTDFCGIGQGVIGAVTAICCMGMGAGLMGEAETIEAMEMNRMATRARRMEFFKGGPSFLRVIAQD